MSERVEQEAPRADGGARPSELAGLEVALVGRLASMSRDEARARLVRDGARYVASPSASTDLVVIGQGGPPLGEDGQPTKSLQRALALREALGRPRILREEEWLVSLGELQGGASLRRLYTTEQLARILSIPPARLRAWVRQGLLRPVRVVKRLAFFDFQEVASAKALDQLARAGVGAGEIRRGLSELAAWLPETEVCLAQLELIERGRDLFVRLEDGRLAETNGQLRLDFGECAEPLPTRPYGSSSSSSTAEAAPRGFTLMPTSGHAGLDWFECGIRAEESGDLVEAAHAYGEALREEGPTPEVCFNLGNVLYAQGRSADAVRQFLHATEVAPDYVEAWNNLGNVLVELGRSAEAVQAYGRALAIAPRYADAHYNLAEALCGLGDLNGARHHWRAYLEEDPTSRWARRVRERLARALPASAPRASWPDA